MLNYKLRIGIVPVRRDVTPRPGIFNWEFAEKRGRECTDYIIDRFTDDQTEFVDIQGVNPVNVMINEKDAAWIAERFNKEKVDAILIINANFGNEEAVGELARMVKKPICLWAPLDDTFEPDGMRYTDSQCGLFGMSRILQRHNIPFSYIENSKKESSVFADGLKKFLSVSCMLKNFMNLKIAQVGLRPQPFTSVIWNEGELMQKFDIRIIPVNLAIVFEKYNRILKEKDKELEQGALLLKSRYEMDDLTPPLLKKVYAFVLLYREIFDEFNVNVISAECWTCMQLGLGAMPCTAYSILADERRIVSCESDMHGAITLALLSCAARGKKAPFFGEFTVRHPDNPNGELLWHCGPFAYSLKAEDSKAKEVNMRQWFRVKDGGYTVARLDQDDGNYSILNGTFRTTSGPYTFGTYLWAQFDDMSRWERKLIEGPYIHHCAEIEGDYTEEIAEFCKYIKTIKNDAM